MHFAAYAAVAQMLQLVPPPTRVVEIGSRDINGTVRPLFNGAMYTGIDRVAGPGVDVVADGATYTPDAVPDCVVCCEVLEHAANWDEIVRNMARMVAPGGSVFITCAGTGRTPHSSDDGGRLQYGEHYENIPHDMLKAAMEHAGLEVRELLGRQDRGDVYACGVKR